MNIGTVARRTGVPAKTIRYYEQIGLIGAATRSENGYRVYDDRDAETLRFIHHARGLGFSVKDVGELLALWRDRGRTAAQVKALALEHVREIDARIAELQRMRRAVQDLADCCHGGHRPDCPILDRLAEAEEVR
jgi:MerR family copper efflux transcriptional regulator